MLARSQVEGGPESWLQVLQELPHQQNRGSAGQGHVGGDVPGQLPLGDGGQPDAEGASVQLGVNRQAVELTAAGLADLVSCPYCPYQTIMDNLEDKVVSQP